MIQMVLASNILCNTACLTGRQLATTKVDWERSSGCVSDTAPPSHRLVLVLPPGQDASRSSVEWNACHRRTNRPTSLPTVPRSPPRRPLLPPRAAEAGTSDVPRGGSSSINKSVSHRWRTRTDVPRMALVSRTSFMTRSVTKL